MNDARFEDRWTCGTKKPQLRFGTKRRRRRRRRVWCLSLTLTRRGWTARRRGRKRQQRHWLDLTRERTRSFPIRFTRCAAASSSAGRLLVRSFVSSGTLPPSKCMKKLPV